ncbi:hypothetical protein [Methylocystis sp.]|uniref:hypothetical protein n=1 Tax=Methylocystis sp. TaxID=1911079 RepID=UPI003D0BC7C4
MEFLDADESWLNSIGDSCLDLTSAWRPPPILTLEKVEALGKVLSLADAINVMAFGGHPPDEVMPDGRPNFANISERRRAATALFSAGLDGVIKFFGSPKEGGDASDPVDRNFFRTSRALGHKDNTIETDQLSVSYDKLEAAWRNEHQRWWNVSVDGASFAAWLTKVLTAERGNLAEARKRICEAVKDNPSLTQTEAIQLVKDASLNISRREVRDLRKQAGGSQGPGPRGPRKNRAAPSA